MRARPIILGLLLAVIILFGIILINPCTTDEPVKLDDVEQVEVVEPVEEVEVTEPVKSEPSVTTPPKTETTTPIVTTPTTSTATTGEKITWRVTAYCACSKCCGKWANNRPTDENGDPIVIGAAGVQLIPNVSCGAAKLPFGTQVQLDGYGTVTVHDRGAKWLVDKYGEYYIDIYMSDHTKASAFGRQYLEGVIL